MKRLIVVCATLLLALVPTGASAAPAAQAGAAKACKAAKAAKKGKARCAKGTKSAAKRTIAGADAATLRAGQRCRAERARLRARFDTSWGGGRKLAMKRCVARLAQDEADDERGSTGAADEGVEGIGDEAVDGEQVVEGEPVVEGDDGAEDGEAVDALDAGGALG